MYVVIQTAYKPLYAALLLSDIQQIYMQCTISVWMSIVHTRLVCTPIMDSVYILSVWHALAELRVPLEGMNIHEHCATGVGDISHMNTTIDPSCQVLGEGGQ